MSRLKKEESETTKVTGQLVLLLRQSNGMILKMIFH
jgi:hypothetical protein